MASRYKTFSTSPGSPPTSQLEMPCKRTNLEIQNCFDLRISQWNLEFGRTERRIFLLLLEKKSAQVAHDQLLHSTYLHPVNLFPEHQHVRQGWQTSRSVDSGYLQCWHLNPRGKTKDKTQNRSLPISITRTATKSHPSPPLGCERISVAMNCLLWSSGSFLTLPKIYVDQSIPLIAKGNIFYKPVRNFDVTGLNQRPDFVWGWT